MKHAECYMICCYHIVGQLSFNVQSLPVEIIHLHMTFIYVCMHCVCFMHSFVNFVFCPILYNLTFTLFISVHISHI